MKDKWLFLTEISTGIFIIFNTWMLTFQTFQLKNYNYIDTTTITQALSSTIFSHLFFWDSQPYFDFFSVHASSFFLVIEPFYTIFPNFIGLYSIQNVLIYSPAVVLYQLFKRAFGDSKYAFLFSFAYLFYPGLFTMFSGEEIIMFIGPAIFAIYFLETERKIPFVISFVLMLSTIEFAPFVGMAFFLYLIVRKGVFHTFKSLLCRVISFKGFVFIFYDFFILSSILLAVGFFFLDTRITLFFSGGTHPIFQNIEGTNFFSISSLLSGLRVDPLTKALNMMWNNGPFLFLSFLDPIFILQLPWFLLTLVSSVYFYYVYTGYYGAFITAFVPVGSINGLKNITKDIPPDHRKSILRRVVVVILVINLLSFTAMGTAQTYYGDLTTHVTAYDQGIVALSQELRQGDLVEVGPNALPVVSMFDWNNILYQNNSSKYIFWGYQQGYYNNLAGYGFYAADGPYALYEKNYTSPPIFNYYNYSDSLQVSQSTSFSFFSPPGNYSVSLNISSVHYSSPIITGKSSDKNFILQSENAIAIPFKVTSPGVLTGIYVPLGSSISPVFYGMISTSVNPLPYGTLSGAYSNFPYLKFDNISLSANLTYYLWLLTQTTGGINSGGISLPESINAGDSYIGNVRNAGIESISKLNFTVPLTLLIKSHTAMPISVSAMLDGKEYNITVSTAGTLLGRIGIVSGSQISLVVSTNVTDYFAYLGSKFSISYYASNSTMPSYFLLNNPYITLAIPLILVTSLICVLNLVNIQDYREKSHNISRTITLLSFVAFWALYALGLEGIVPFIYNFLIFKAVGVVLVISFLFTVISYEWR